MGGCGRGEGHGSGVLRVDCGGGGGGGGGGGCTRDARRAFLGVGEAVARHR